MTPEEARVAATVGIARARMGMVASEQLREARLTLMERRRGMEHLVQYDAIWSARHKMIRTALYRGYGLSEASAAHAASTSWWR
jgi:hypothetical protein